MRPLPAPGGRGLHEGWLGTAEDNGCPFTLKPSLQLSLHTVTLSPLSTPVLHTVTRGPYSFPVLKTVTRHHGAEGSNHKQCNQSTLTYKNAIPGT